MMALAWRLARDLVSIVLMCMAFSTLYAAPRVYLATMQPGEQFFERFGHNAILIFDANRTPSSIAYNFGYFDFQQQNFLSNFVQGKMAYLGVALDGQADLQRYVEEGRSVWLQELDFNESQIIKLEGILQKQTTPPNDIYRYDYFRSNCSTKIRDALNEALDGQLERGLLGRSHGYTFRSLGISHAQSPLWLYLGIHAGLGPSTDRQLSMYEESFIPSLLQRALVELKITQADGTQTPLVIGNQRYGSEAENKLPNIPAWRWNFLVIGLVIAIFIALGFRFRRQYFLRRFSAIVASICALILGLGGLLLVYLWVATDHQDAYFNLNLTLLNPLWLCCLPALIASAFATAKPIGRRISLIAQMATIVAGIGIALKTLPFVRQINLEFVLLIAPIILALHFALRTRAQADAMTDK
jgi:Domain of unknown function (DUF4105)